MKPIRTIQKEHILNILSINKHKENEINTCEEQKQMIWKVLILDSHTQSILSPIIKIKELRENDITLHLRIDSKRLPIEDAPVVYFIEPTLTNLELIEMDFQKQSYNEYYFSFSSYASREFLEDLANIAVKYNTADKVKRVKDEYLDFVCLESNLFSLNMENTYQVLNDPKMNENQIKEYMERIATKLLSMLMVTNNNSLLLRYEKSVNNSGSEYLVGVLKKKIQDHMKLKISKTTKTNVLLILDRGYDLITPLTHKWTYGGLVYDCLEMKFNKVKCLIDEINKIYDIDMEDSFWTDNSELPFPQVAENADQELQKYKTEMDKITNNFSINDPSIQTQNLLENNENSLQSALWIMPKLTKKKRMIDAHMNLALLLLKEIQDRKLDIFFEFEQSLRKQNKKSFMELFHSPLENKQIIIDKVRLLILYYLIGPDELTDSELEKCIEYLENNDFIDIRNIIQFLNYTKTIKIRDNENIGKKEMSMSDGSPTSITSQYAQSYINKIKDKSLSSMLENLVSGMRNLLPSITNIPIIKLIDQMLSLSFINNDILDTNNSNNISISGLSTNYEKSFNSLVIVQKDCTIKDKSDMPNYQLLKEYNEVFVFILGGISYDEYQLLNNHIKKQFKNINVIIGATEIISSTSLLNQLNYLGSQQR